MKKKKKILLFNLFPYHSFNIRINLSKKKKKKKLAPNFKANSPAVNITTVSKALFLEVERAKIILQNINCCNEKKNP